MAPTDPPTTEPDARPPAPARVTMHEPWYHLWQRHPTPAAVDLDDPLGGALNDALVLVAFTAQSRRNFQKESLVALTLAAETLSEGRRKKVTPTAEELGKFWAAYDDLAAAAAPANAQSIRATIAFSQKRFPESLFSATGANGLIALIAFFACVALQGFWSAGRDLVAKVDAFDADKTKMQTRIRDMDAVRSRAGERYLQLRGRLCQEKDKCTGDATSPTDGAADLPKLPESPTKEDDAMRIRAEAQLAYADFMDKRASGKELHAQHEQIRLSALEMEHSVLKWRDSSYSVCRVLIGVCPIEPDKPKEPTGFAPRTAARHSADTLVASNSTFFGPTANVPIETSDAGENERAFRDTLQQIRVNLRSIGDYWIPMSMGLLGAMTFILRSLTIQLREFAYVPRSMSVSVIRICLGAVAGVFGALLSPTTEGALKGLPPLFVPFVFGYGIEILFSLMDHVVTSFTQGESTVARAKVLG